MVKVKFEAVLSEIWGVSDLLADTHGWTVEDIKQEILDLMNEDISSVLDEGRWEIEIEDEPEYRPIDLTTAGMFSEA